MKNAFDLLDLANSVLYVVYRTVEVLVRICPVGIAVGYLLPL